MEILQDEQNIKEMQKSNVNQRMLFDIAKIKKCILLYVPYVGIARFPCTLLA
jgi:hypothetical protein